MKVTREGEVFLPHDPCGDRVDSILAMVQGDLSTPEEKTLLAHVEHCPGCASFLELHELIDDEFHSYFTAKKVVVPREIPKKVGIQLALTRKKNLAMWLHELGRAIFFQQPEAVDRYHPGWEPYSSDRCLKMVENVCASTLTDPFWDEVGLSSRFVADCHVFVHDLGKWQDQKLSLRITKEVLNRSLAVEPESVPVLKSLADYHRFNNDFSSAVSEFKKALEISRSDIERGNLHGSLASLWRRMGDLDSSLHAIELAKQIRNNFNYDFYDFLNYITIRNLQQARECLTLMDKRIETEALSSAELISVTLISKWIFREKENFVSMAARDEEIIKLLSKYAGRLAEG